eukprot:scaffold17066_cov34-Prasinocladus_malaysianus.AAC.1
MLAGGVLVRAGQRICDRAITSIAYFNKDWTEQDGGCLRVQKLDGTGHEDIAPRSGRLVIFMRRCHQHRRTQNGHLGLIFLKIHERLARSPSCASHPLGPERLDTQGPGIASRSRAARQARRQAGWSISCVTVLHIIYYYLLWRSMGPLSGSPAPCIGPPGAAGRSP